MFACLFIVCVCLLLFVFVLFCFLFFGGGGLVGGGGLLFYLVFCLFVQICALEIANLETCIMLVLILLSVESKRILNKISHKIL